MMILTFYKKKLLGTHIALPEFLKRSIRMEVESEELLLINLLISSFFSLRDVFIIHMFETVRSDFMTRFTYHTH